MLPSGAIPRHPERAATFMRSVKTQAAQENFPGKIADALHETHAKIKAVLGGSASTAAAAASLKGHNDASSSGVLDVPGVGVGVTAAAAAGSPLGFAADDSVLDAKAALAEMMTHAWTAPTFIITLGNRDDTSAIGPALRELISTQGSAAVKRNLRATPGVDIRKWPERIDVAEYAVSGVLTHTAHPDSLEGLRGLPWLDILLKRDARSGKVTDPVLLELSHHFGCLFAHMTQWQLAADLGNRDTFVFESDGFSDALLGVPVSALGDVQHRAPADYDVVFLHMPGTVAGAKVSEFRTALGESVEMYEFKDTEGSAGLSAYMFSDRFVRKIQLFLATQGADMVDAWLMGHLCRPLREGDWTYDLPKHGVKYGESFLNCYKAMTKGSRGNNNIPGRPMRR